MKYRILALGKLRDRNFRALVQDFEQRIAQLVPFESLELRDEKLLPGRDPAQLREAEAERILGKIHADTCVVALDEAGTGMGSRELAAWLESLERSRREIAFCVGGALGHGEVLLRRADSRLSLSPMTMNHYLARLVLAEQLYRAISLTRGMPYHND